MGTKFNCFKLYKNSFRLNIRKYFFTCRVIDVWNSLDNVFFTCRVIDVWNSLDNVIVCCKLFKEFNEKLKDSKHL